MKTYRLLKAIHPGAKVEPVSVLNPDQLRVPKSAFGAAKKHYTLEAENVLKKWVRGIKDPNLTAPALLQSEHYSRRGTVQTLLAYVKSSGAGMIGLNTHCRKGMVRWFLGSFAETLLLHSPVPVLLVNPKTKVPKRIKTILFPTDLSDSSKRSLDKLAPIAQEMKAKLVIHHKVEYVLPETALVLGAAPVYTNYTNDDAAERLKKIEKWAEDLNRAGVETTTVFDRKPRYVSGSILAEAKKQKADLIAMASEATTFSSVVVGSTAREVVRQSPIPVLVFHS